LYAGDNKVHLCILRALSFYMASFGNMKVVDLNVKPSLQCGHRVQRLPYAYSDI